MEKRRWKSADGSIRNSKFSFLQFFISDVITPPRLRRYSSYLKLIVETKKGKG
jgi:hypothetical protein